MYEILKSNQEEPLGKIGWNRSFDLSDAEWENIFSLPFKLTQNTKLQWFQFRINHKILATNLFLHKIKKIDTNICTFCIKEIETIEHIFWECEVVQGLSEAFSTLCFSRIHKYITYSKKDFILGSHVKSEKVKTLIALQIKYFIYSMRCANNTPSLNGLMSSIKILYDINKIIAKKNNEQEKFDEAWKYWKNLFN